MNDPQGNRTGCGQSGDAWAPEGMPDFYRPEEPKVGAPSLPQPPVMPDATRPQASVMDDATTVHQAVDDRTVPRNQLPQAWPSPAASEATPPPAPVQAAAEAPTVGASAAPTTPLPVPAAVPVEAARPAEPAVAAPAPAPRLGGRRTRKARLRLARIDPWSVMKTTFLFSVAFGVMLWVATYVAWSVIGASGLFDALNQFLQQLLSSPNDQTTYRIEDFVNTNKVLGIAALVGVVNVVLMTALGTLAAFLYNLSANILGGLEVTLAED